MSQHTVCWTKLLYPARVVGRVRRLRDFEIFFVEGDQSTGTDRRISAGLRPPSCGKEDKVAGMSKVQHLSERVLNTTFFNCFTSTVSVI
jgi:hypothetical protein